MNLIKWEPFKDFESFFDDLAPMRIGGAGGLSPDLAVDIYEEGDAYVAEMNMPGMSSDKIDVQVRDGHLHISGAREEQHEKKGRNYYRKEIRSGSFERMVTIPGPVEQGKVTAAYKNGTLKVTMPKQEKGTSAHKVQVTE
jgi:HSP20 family protein